MKIAITGSIGAGKSAVRKILEELGYRVYDGDVLAHSVYEPDTAVYQKLLDRYGTVILDKEGRIDRKRLAAIVFQDDQELAFLEASVFPALRTLIQNQSQPAFYELALLYEANLEDLFDAVWVVEAAEALRHQRLLSRGMDLNDVLKREKRQLKPEEKRRRADLVLTNNGDLDLLRTQIIHELKRRDHEP